MKNNIAFGILAEKIDREMVEQAAKVVNLHSFIISELPKGYQTVVGGRRSRLSVGQRQRVSIARTLFTMIQKFWCFKRRPVPLME